MGCVDQQPSGEPEVSDKSGNQQQPGDETVVTGPEEEQARVESVSASGEAHGNTQVTREDSPQANGESEGEHVNTSKDYFVVVVVVERKK